jgi:hypothetical protein
MFLKEKVKPFLKKCSLQKGVDGPKLFDFFKI